MNCIRQQVKTLHNVALLALFMLRRDAGLCRSRISMSLSQPKSSLPSAFGRVVRFSHALTARPRAVALALACLLISLAPCRLEAQDIATVAGNGTAGYNGDNIPATSAELNVPTGVALDSAGNVYIADYINNRIRKVNASGVITTVAGNGTAGYNGDNIAATSAELNSPNGVALDSAGNLYIADQANQRIRMVNTGSGIITTVAGSGIAGYNGDNIPATSAELSFPLVVVVDSADNLYIADSVNSRIRMVNAGGTITTVAGNGTAGYNGDHIAATSAELNIPHGVALDSAGNLYIADFNNSRIRMVNASGIITTVAGNGTAGYNGDNIAATSAELNTPTTAALDSADNLYIADNANQRIRKVNASGIITTVAGNGTAGYNGDNIPATSAELNYPVGVAVNGAGNLYIADTYNQRIRKVPLRTRARTHNTWTSGAAMPTAVQGPATGAIGSKVYVVGGASNTAILDINQIYNATTNKWTTGASMPTQRFAPAGAVVNGILYVIGGNLTGGDPLDVVEAYDPTTNTWSTKSPMPTPRDSIGAAVKNGIIYVIGGYNNTSNRLATVESYNPATDSWTEESPLAVAKSLPAVGLLGSTIVAAGGFTDSGAVTGDNEGYNSTKNSWKNLTADPTPREAGCAASISGLLYFAGGTEFPPLSVNESFSAADNKWTTLASMPLAVVAPGSATVNNKLYCFGGSDNGSVFQGTVYDNVQIYHP